MDRRVYEKREQVAAICREYHVRRLALFGSALGDDFDPVHSDLDFVVEFELLPEGTYADTYFGLIEALERLFQRHVDLVQSRKTWLRPGIEHRHARAINGYCHVRQRASIPDPRAIERQIHRSVDA